MLERLRQLPAWVVVLALLALLLAWAWWMRARDATDDEDQGDEEGPAAGRSIPPSTAGGLVAPMVYATNDVDESQESGTSSVPPTLTMPGSTSKAQYPSWMNGGNTATPADTYSTGHPTPVTYS